MLFNTSSFKIFISGCFIFLSMSAASQSVGIFDGHNDVGKISHAGNAIYNPSSDEYLVSGSGANIWFAHDDLHYLWKKMTGDFILQAGEINRQRC